MTSLSHYRHPNYRMTADAVIVNAAVNLDHTIAIVTGGSGTIGQATVAALVRAGAIVINTGRSAETLKEAEAKVAKDAGRDGRVVSVVMDLSDFASVRTGCAAIASEVSRLSLPVKLLIHNSAVMAVNYRLASNGADLQWMTNCFGPWLMIQELMPMLKSAAPSRIVLVASVAHHTSFGGAYRIMYERLPSVSSAEYLRWEPYQQSKLALIMLAAELNDRYKADGVTAYSCNPGGIRSGLQKEAGVWPRLIMSLLWWLFKTPAQGAATQIYCGVQPGLEVSGNGQYYDNCAAVSPPDYLDKLGAGVNKLERERLWSYIEQFVETNGKLPRGTTPQATTHNQD
jgi:dehydrogenase/reductase SDR family protein 13